MWGLQSLSTREWPISMGTHTFILLNFSSVVLSDLSTSLSSASYFSRMRL